MAATAATDNTLCSWPPRSPDLTVVFRQGQCFRPPHHFQRHYQNCTEHINTAIGTAHKTCLIGFGGNGSIAWTSAVSHGGRTSNAFKGTMKLQTFLFQMVVTACIYVQYLLKYGFAKPSDNLYTPCISLVFPVDYSFQISHLVIGCQK